MMCSEEVVSSRNSSNRRSSRSSSRSASSSSRIEEYVVWTVALGGEPPRREGSYVSRSEAERYAHALAKKDLFAFVSTRRGRMLRLFRKDG